MNFSPYLLALTISTTIFALVIGIVFKTQWVNRKKNKKNYHLVHPELQYNKHLKKQEKIKTCPLCDAGLISGELVKSVLYPGKPDQLMEIFGCPYCYKPSRPAHAEQKYKRSHGSVSQSKIDKPLSNKQKQIDRIRKCPVCKNNIPDKGCVIARMFPREKRNHVHVLGCTECYKKKKSYDLA